MENFTNIRARSSHNFPENFTPNPHDLVKLWEPSAKISPFSTDNFARNFWQVKAHKMFCILLKQFMTAAA